MRLLFLFLIIFLPLFSGFSQSPQGFNYQAIVRDINGNIRSNQGVQFIFQIRDASGSSVYEEVHSVVTNKYGLADDIIIGKGATSDDFSAIDWSNGNFFVNVKVDGVDMGTTQLLSVPYALYALKAGSGGGSGADGVGISSTVDNGNGTFTLNYTDGTSFTTINLTGPEGQSAYHIWLSSGQVGTEQDFLLSLRGEKGEKGDRGLRGPSGQDGAPGKDAEITGGASSVVTDDLDTSRVLVSNTAGKIAVSGIASNELNQLDKIRSNVQDQLDSKQTLNDNLTTISDLDPLDGTFIVGDGTKFVSETPSEVRSSLSLGNMAMQNADNIVVTGGSITGGSITGITDLSVADGGTGASNAFQARLNLNVDVAGTDNSIDVTLTNVPSNFLTLSGQEITVGIVPIELGGTAATSAEGARANLRLGSIATQDSTAISIVGGTITGITDLTVADGGTGASNPEDARINLGLGSIATQDSTALNISGGTITGITDLAIADGGTGASTAIDARTNLGLAIGSDVQAYDKEITDIAALEPTKNFFIVGDGTTFVKKNPENSRIALNLGSMATQDVSNVKITGGRITDVEDILIADGGTGASTAIDARTNLGLAIGTDVQAYDAELAAVAGLTSAADKGIQFTGDGTAATYDLTAAGKALLDDADATAQRTTLGVVLGTDVQAYDPELAAVAGLTSAADKGIQFTGDGTAATYDLTAAGKALLDDADAAAQRTTLGVVLGTNVQAYDAELAAVAGLTSAADKGIQFTGDGTAATYDLTAAGKALLDDADATAQRTTLGVVLGTDVQAYDAELAAVAGLTSAADKGIQFTGDGTAATYDLTAAGKALLDDADATAQRTTLGVVLGTDVQAYDAELAAVAGLTSAADKGIQFTGDGTAATYDLTAAGKALLDDADATAQRTTLGVVLGTDVQAYDAELAAVAGLTSAADKGIQFTGDGTAATYDLTAAGKALLDDADATAQRTTLGVVLGTDVQAYDAELAAVAGLTSAADKGIQFTGDGTAATYDLTAAGKALLDDADATAQRTTLGVVLGTDVQAYDAELAAVAGLTSAADKGIQFTGDGTAATYDLTAAGKALLDDADATAQRTTLGVVLGTNVQAYDAELAAVAGLTSAADKGIQFTGDGTAATYDLTAAGRSLLDDASIGDMRTTLGVDAAGTDNSTPVTLATVNDNYLSITGQAITAGNVPISLGGTGANSKSGALVNLGLTATASEINLIDASSAGTIVNSKAVIYGSSGEVNATTLQIAGSSITADAAEINILDGVTGVTATELSYIGDVTSNIQSQIDGKQVTISGAATTIDTEDLTASRAMVTDASGKVGISDVTATELSYLDGVTSNIQTQLNNQSSITGLSDALVEDNSIYLGNDPASSTSSAEKNAAVGTAALSSVTQGDENVAMGYNALTGLTTGSKNVGVGTGVMSGVVTGEGNMAVGYNALSSVTSGNGNVALGRQVLTKVTTGARNVGIGRQAGLQIVDGSPGGTSLLDGDNNTYIGAQTVSSATNVSNETVIGYGATGQGANYVVLGNADVTRVYAAQDAGATLYAGGLNIGGTAITSSADELNYLDGVTSAIQTQLDAKNGTISGAATTIASNDLTASRALTSNGSGKVAVSDVTATELGYLDGVTSAIQTQLDAKNATISGAATTIASNDLTASRALTSNGSGKVAVSDVTATELGYLDGVHLQSRLSLMQRTQQYQEQRQRLLQMISPLQEH